MSHNTLKLNTNSFDVNSNRTESISNPLYAYVSTVLGTPPKTFVTGDDFLFQRQVVQNTFNTSTQLDLIDHPSYSNYVQYIRIKEDGLYRIIMRGLLRRASSGSSYTRRCEIYDQTNIISSHSLISRNLIRYNTLECCYGIVERSGTDVDISLRINSLSGVSLGVGGYNQSFLLVERLQ
jgi:hypothetical protein